MKRCLIVLTRKYPYSYGEPSLDDEFRHHQPYYEKMIVLAQDIGKGAATTRNPIPAVTYFNTATASRAAGRALDKLRCFRFYLRRTQAVKSDRARVRFRPVRRYFLYSFEERCSRMIREAKDTLCQFDWSGYDRIVLYSYWFFANARAAVGIAEYLKTKTEAEIVVVSRAHRYDLYENRNRLHYLPEREYLLQNVEAVYACSLDGGAYLRGNHPLFADKIKTAYVGTTDYGRCELPPGEGFHIVSCCRIVPMKRLELLIAALRQVSRGKIHWTCIGGGIEGDAYFQRVKTEACQALDGHPNVSYTFTGALPHDEVLQYYRDHRVDAFVNVSESEGLPAVLMEAGSFGIPLVATNVGGTAEIVHNGQNGYLLAADFAPSTLAAMLMELAETAPADLDAMRSRSREIWCGQFNSSVNYAAFANELATGGDAHHEAN